MHKIPSNLVNIHLSPVFLYLSLFNGFLDTPSLLKVLIPFLLTEGLLV